MLTHDNITFTAQSVLHSARGPGRRRSSCCSCRWPTSSPGLCVCHSLCIGAGTIVRPQPRHASPRTSRSRGRTGSRACRGSTRRSTPRSSAAPRPRAALALKIFSWALRGRRRGQRLQAAQAPDPGADEPEVRHRHQAGVLEDPRGARRPGALVHQRRGAAQPGHREVLPRRRRAHPRGHRHDREHLLHQRQPDRQLPLRLGRPDRSRYRAEDRRRGRGHVPRPQRDEGVLQDAGGDGGDPHRRRLAVHRRPRRDRRRGLPADHRPQEGPDHHRRRQERRAVSDRGRDRDLQVHQPGVRDRRPPALPDRARHPRLRQRRRLRARGRDRSSTNPSSSRATRASSTWSSP